MQDREAQKRRARDLQKSTPQAAAGMNPIRIYDLGSKKLTSAASS
jgi:hypothetical protein